LYWHKYSYQLNNESDLKEFMHYDFRTIIRTVLILVALPQIQE